MLEFALQRAGYEVAAAADGRQALDRIRELRPHLVVLDEVSELVGVLCRSRTGGPVPAPGRCTWPWAAST